MWHLSLPLPRLTAESAGLFVSPGYGRHPRRTLPSHELIFVRSGCLHLWENGREWALQPGATLLLQPGLTHDGVGEYPKGLSFYWVHFTLPRGRVPGKTVRIPKWAHVERPERLAELFHRFLDDQESGQLQPAEAAALIVLMLCETRRQQAAVSEATHDLAGRAQAHIVREFARGIGTAEVARHLRVNPDYLGRVFRAATGLTVTEAIHREQLREARALLREGTGNIDEVARASGFRDASHFRRLFTRANGLSPRAYRHLYARVKINRR